MAESVPKNHSDFDSVCGCGDLHTPCVRVRYLTPTRHNSNHLEYIHAQKKKRKKITNFSETLYFTGRDRK